MSSHDSFPPIIFVHGIGTRNEKLLQFSSTNLSTLIASTSGGPNQEWTIISSEELSSLSFTFHNEAASRYLGINRDGSAPVGVQAKQYSWLWCIKPIDKSRKLHMIANPLGDGGALELDEDGRVFLGDEDPTNAAQQWTMIADAPPSRDGQPIAQAYQDDCEYDSYSEHSGENDHDDDERRGEGSHEDWGPEDAGYWV